MTAASRPAQKLQLS